MYFLPQFRDQGHTPHCAFGMIWYCCYGSTHIYTQFDAQNAGNSVSELPDVKFSNFVNTIAYSSQTGCPFQTLLIPLVYYMALRS